MKKIGIILSYSSSGGGIYQYAISILEALYISKYKVKIIFFKDYWSNTLKDFSDKFELYPLTNKNVFIFSKLLLFLKTPVFAAQFLSKYINPISKITESLDCDFWIFPYPDPLSYQLRLNSIVAIHDLMHIYEPRFPEASGFLRTPIRDYRFKSITKNAKLILADSDIGKRHICDSYSVPKEKVKVLPFIPSKYISHENFKRKNYEELNFPKKFFFYPSKFWKHKNHINLLRAIKKVKEYHPDIHLVLTGDKKNEFRRIMKHIEMLNISNHVSIVFEIDKDNILHLYMKSRALVMPTFFGPTNIPPLEAINCNCPMAVSNIYGMPKQLGKAAIYFDPNSVNDIANKLKLLWEDDLLIKRLKYYGKQKKEFISINAHKRRIEFLLENIQKNN